MDRRQARRLSWRRCFGHFLRFNQRREKAIQDPFKGTSRGHKSTDGMSCLHLKAKVSVVDHFATRIGTAMAQDL